MGLTVVKLFHRFLSQDNFRQHCMINCRTCGSVRTISKPKKFAVVPWAPLASIVCVASFPCPERFGMVKRRRTVSRRNHAPFSAIGTLSPLIQGKNHLTTCLISELETLFPGFLILAQIVSMRKWLRKRNIPNLAVSARTPEINFLTHLSKT